MQSTIDLFDNFMVHCMYVFRINVCRRVFSNFLLGAHQKVINDVKPKRSQLIELLGHNFFKFKL